VGHRTDFIPQISLNILTPSLCRSMQFLDYFWKVSVFLLPVPKLVIYFLRIFNLIQGITQLKLDLLCLQKKIFLFVALLFGCLQTHRGRLYFSFVLIYLLTGLVLPFLFLSQAFQLLLELLNICFHLLYRFSSLFLLSLTNLNVLLSRLKGNLYLAPQLWNFLFFTFVLLIQEFNTP